MKAYYLLIAPLAASALVGCAVYPEPVASRVVTTPATVAVAPAYVAPSSSTVILGAGPIYDTDHDGYADSVDRYPYDARYH